MEYKCKIAKLIENVLVDFMPAEEVEELKIESLLETPPDRAMGDLAFPCFCLARKMRKAPPMIAQTIKDALKEDSFLDRVCTAGGYLNFYFNRGQFSEAVLKEIKTQGQDYGKSNEGEGKTVIVEFSSPNIAKPFHIGHLVSTALGNSIRNIYDFLGYKTVAVNHLGDWGTQFGKLISAYKRWGDAEAVKADPINELLKIYVKFHEVAKEQPELEDEARENFKLLEEGDKEITELWKFFVDASLVEFNKMYDMLGISFDSYAGESFYSDKMPEVVDILYQKGLLEESEGARIVRFEDENVPPCIILKSDGSTIYATRDIAAAIYRKRTYDFHKNIYVVGVPQALHFKQVFGVIDKMGFEWNQNCVHVGFGYVRFPDRAMSTRHGDVVLLKDVLAEAISKTKEVMENNANSKQLDDIEDISEKVGIGAILYAFLRSGRERDIIFTWKDMLDFEGESGPYVQYSYARGKSILRRATEEGIDYSNPDYSLLNSDEEFALIKLLNEYKDAVSEAAQKYEPCFVTRYVTDLAQQFNKFYNNCNIMKSEDGYKEARLALIDSACVCIRSALTLLGIKVVEKM